MEDRWIGLAFSVGSGSGEGDQEIACAGVNVGTAMGAAILAWHALVFLREEGGELSGVINGEDLARLLPRSRADAIRRDLVAWDIDLFETVRDATPV